MIIRFPLGFSFGYGILFSQTTTIGKLYLAAALSTYCGFTHGKALG